MDGSYGPAAEKVQTFVGVLRTAITVPIKMWGRAVDEFAGEQNFNPGRRAAR